MYFCHLYPYGPVGRIILVTIVGGLILFIFMYNLSTTADGYLAPTLEYLVIRFKINESLAGVTLLGFGNGAPDVFASISANVGGSDEHPDPNNTLLSICSLIGGTCFLTSVVQLLITRAMRPNMLRVTRMFFLRDVIFFIITICYLLFLMLVPKEFNIFYSLMFLGIYFIFVGIAVFQSKKYP